MQVAVTCFTTDSNFGLREATITAIKKNTTSSVNDCTVEDVELLTSPTEC